MSTQRGTKLNQMIANTPRGTVLVAKYLKKRGINLDLLKKYKNSKWIEPIGRGAYKLYNDKIEWTGGVYSLQTHLDLPIHVGGKTALAIKGLSHYISPQAQKIFLYGLPNSKLPAWFKAHDWGVDIKYTMTNLFPPGEKVGMTHIEQGEFSVIASSPERAVLEMLYHVPSKITFNEASLITENLISLRVEMTEKLLASCKSIKVKRLFLFFADRHQHGWFKKMNHAKIDIGRGKRAIVKGGSFDKKYMITVEDVQNEKSY